MPVSSSPLAHRDIRAAMDRALAGGRGVRIACSSLGEAYNLRQRFYTTRKHDRDQSRQIYEPDDPGYDRTPYDALIVYPATGEDDVIYCVIEVSSAERLNERIQDL